MLYNEACAWARSGKTSESIAALREAVAAGCVDVAMIRGDEDLAPLHDNDEFKRIVTELEGR
jgi:fructoselysine-6-P-deglycase FrlB-like protein